MATHCSVLARSTPWTEEPGGLHTVHGVSKSQTRLSMPYFPVPASDFHCLYSIKRHLPLGRRAMANLDSVLKSRDITLPTKINKVKTIIFPVVMCGCESWILKDEHQRIDAFQLQCWRRLLIAP